MIVLEGLIYSLVRADFSTWRVFLVHANNEIMPFKQDGESKQIA